MFLATDNWCVADCDGVLYTIKHRLPNRLLGKSVIFGVLGGDYKQEQASNINYKYIQGNYNIQATPEYVECWWAMLVEFKPDRLSYDFAPIKNDYSRRLK